MCSWKLTSRKQKVDQVFGPENCTYLDVNFFFLNFISQPVFNKGGPRDYFCSIVLIYVLQNLGNSSFLSSVYPYILMKAAQVRPQVIFILSWFHLTKFFREEKLSWLGCLQKTKWLINFFILRGAQVFSSSFSIFVNYEYTYYLTINLYEFLILFASLLTKK